MLTGGLILAAGKSVGPALMWLGGMIVAVMIAGLIILKIRGAMFAKQTGGAEQEGLLAGLRRMRDAGQISIQEYDTARKSMAARAAGLPAPPRKPTDEQRSRPGFDLTGERLPDQPAQGDE